MQAKPRSSGPWTFRVICSAALIGGCAAPMTQMGSISREDLQAEQLKQQQLVIRSELKDQQRVENVGYPLLQAALPLCGPNATGTRSGLRFANAYSFKKDYQPAARAMGFTDTLAVVAIARGSAAANAGIEIGDRIIQVSDQPAPIGKNADRKMMEQLGELRERVDGVSYAMHHGPLAVPGGSTTGLDAQAPSPRAVPVGSDSVVQTGAATRNDTTTATAVREVPLTFAPDTVCDYTLVAIKNDQLNAWADGRTVYVTSAMLRFAADDDELAVVLSHEISHNAMRHMDAKKRNMTIGAIFGAVLDAAAASQGVNTGGEFTNDFAAAASQVFSQEFESEADYVGMYLLARSHRPYTSAADFWRRMAQESPGSIKFASSHPTTAERYLRLDRTATEIQGKEARGDSLLPEMKEGNRSAPR